MSKKKAIRLNRYSFHPRRIMLQLAACEEGKGLVLDKEDRNHVWPLVKAGFVDWIRGGPITVHKATKLGREVASEFRNQHPSHAAPNP